MGLTEMKRAPACPSSAHAGRPTVFYLVRRRVDIRGASPESVTTPTTANGRLAVCSVCTRRYILYKSSLLTVVVFESEARRPGHVWLKRPHTAPQDFCPRPTGAAMGHNQLSLLISFICVLLLWPQVQMGSISSKVSAEDATSAEEGKERPLALKRSIEACDTSFDSYCLHGQCMLLVDENKNHCKCELGFHGTRCEHPQLVYKPLSDGELALYIVCGILLIIGLAGALYFFCKWYKKKSLPQQPKRQGYRVQTA